MKDVLDVHFVHKFPPDIFSMNEQGFAVAQGIETTDVAAQEAKEGCPVGAIEEV